MVRFTVRSEQLSEKDIYDIEKAEPLTSYLKPGSSLCLVHDPEWTSGWKDLLRISGRKRNGEPDRVYLAEGGNGIDQGYYRCFLGKTLASPFLFASWKKKGCHQVSLIQRDREPIRFDSFDEALDAYLPEGFTAEYSFRRKSVLILMVLVMQRRQLFSDLLAVMMRKMDVAQQTIEDSF